MASHHFLGTGLVSADLVASAGDGDALLERIEQLVAGNGITVMARRVVAFPDDGLTLVWVLAESHLVLHYWAPEGYATIDLHICDYRSSNAAKARGLAAALGAFCFREGSASWHEHHLERPEVSAETAPEPLPATAPG